jgi:hypothetical protein
MLVHASSHIAVLPAAARRTAEQSIMRQQGPGAPEAQLPVVRQAQACAPGLMLARMLAPVSMATQQSHQQKHLLLPASSTADQPKFHQTADGGVHKVAEPCVRMSGDSPAINPYSLRRVA